MFLHLMKSMLKMSGMYKRSFLVSNLLPCLIYPILSFFAIYHGISMLTRASSICLSALMSSSYLALPDPVHIQSDGRNRSPTRSYNSASPSHSEVSLGSPRGDSGILVLNKCKHAFHFACINSWFNYRCYKCPLCQTSYAPPELV